MSKDHDILDHEAPPVRSDSSGGVYSLLATGILLMFFLLIIVDKDTQSLKDIFNVRILPALLLYFTPAFVVSSVLYELFHKRFSMRRSLLLALLIGVVVSFGGIILVFYLI
ncbi:MAG: hypothetical protein DHS20C18_43150 [Saprospiraceae bacterium]|nr:MAG: hypothetical protein DHS20C18_43150 [Saprospiraceae bacterium]